MQLPCSVTRHDCPTTRVPHLCQAEPQLGLLEKAEKMLGLGRYHGLDSYSLDWGMFLLTIRSDFPNLLSLGILLPDTLWFFFTCPTFNHHYLKAGTHLHYLHLMCRDSRGHLELVRFSPHEEQGQTPREDRFQLILVSAISFFCRWLSTRIIKESPKQRSALSLSVHSLFKDI